MHARLLFKNLLTIICVCVRAQAHMHVYILVHELMENRHRSLFIFTALSITQYLTQSQCSGICGMNEGNKLSIRKVNKCNAVNNCA